jgi:hypothetical protein
MAYARHQKTPSSGGESHGGIELCIHQKDMKTRTLDPPSDRTPRSPSVNSGATREEVGKSHSISGRVA